jgi:mono/diheme cytochrome c family protein
MPTAKLLALALLIAATGPAPAQQGSGKTENAARGEVVYSSACARCHASAERLVRPIAGETPEEKRAWLDAFLVKHYPLDSESRADLIDFLLGK